MLLSILADCYKTCEISIKTTKEIIISILDSE